MKILTLEDTCLELNKLPDVIEEDVRFAILDNSNPREPDFFFPPLIFLESFSSPAIVMKIGGKEIIMPLDWYIAVGDTQTGNDLEILPLTSVNDRDFEAFVYNPLSSFRPEFQHIEIINFYNDVKWYFPKVKPGQLLAVPLENGEKPICAYFIKEIARQYELIDYTRLI